MNPFTSLYLNPPIDNTETNTHTHNTFGSTTPSGPSAFMTF